MRASRLPYVWAFWFALASLAVWWAVAPAGYLPYSKQWLLHLRFSELWPSDQHAVADGLIVPALSRWADQLGEAVPARNVRDLHEAGTAIPSIAWSELETRYRARGIEIIDQPTFLNTGAADLTSALALVSGGQPAALKALYADIENRLAACQLPACAQHPHVAWVYVVLDSGLSLTWPGGNQIARYDAGHSPSLEYTGRGGQPYVAGVLESKAFFEPLGGDALGFGDTMTAMHPIALPGAKGFVAADVYWDDGPIRSIQWSVLAYSAWALVSAIAAFAALIGIAAVRTAMLRDGDGVCVTIDIVGWSQIEDVRERFKRQWTLDSIVVRAFLASTKQRLVRWSTGDGYHVLFMDHWGAKMYSEVLVFLREVLAQWDARVRPDPSMKGAALRISVGSHGSVRMRRRHGEWIAMGDRIVSAVRIDEVSKKIRDPARNRWTVAMEQSFKNEVRLAAHAAYEESVAKEVGPLTETDKSGKAHQFSLLDLNPTVLRDGRTPRLWGAAVGFFRSVLLRDRVGEE